MPATAGKASCSKSGPDWHRPARTTPSVNAGAYAGDGLLSILEVRFHSGQREILVDECTTAQILEVLAWQSCVEDDDRFDDLVVHLARRN